MKGNDDKTNGVVLGGDLLDVCSSVFVASKANQRQSFKKTKANAMRIGRKVCQRMPIGLDKEWNFTFCFSSATLVI